MDLGGLGVGQTPLIKNTLRYYNTLTQPQNGRNHISEDLIFKNSLGADAPRHPYRGTPFAVHISNTLL